MSKKLLKSRVPYMTDEEWTDFVHARADSLGPVEVEGDQEPLDAVQNQLVNTLRNTALGFSMPERLDRTVGNSELVNEGEARAIRDMWHEYLEFDKNPSDAIAAIFNVAVQVVEDVMDGKIWPYAGGVLRPLPLAGLNLTSGYTTTQRHFIRSAVRLAKEELKPDDFEIICNNNGMTVADANKLIRKTELRSGRQYRQRYRDILVRHATGSDVEKCILSQRKRARKDTTAE